MLDMQVGDNRICKYASLNKHKDMPKNQMQGKKTRETKREKSTCNATLQYGRRGKNDRNMLFV